MLSVKHHHLDFRFLLTGNVITQYGNTKCVSIKINYFVVELVSVLRHVPLDFFPRRMAT